MRVRKRLLVNGRQVPLAVDMVHLALNEIGRGTFDVLEEVRQAEKSLVEFYVGVADDNEYLLLTGVLLESQMMSAGRTRLGTRELCVVLDMPIIFNLHHATPRDVIARIEQRTGLHFLLPAGAPYLSDRRINFVHYGSGTEALNLIAKKWELKGMVWFQLPEGQIYWGHWSAGPYTKATVPMESHLISDVSRENRELWLPCIPALRPGMVVQVQDPQAGIPAQFRIDALDFTGERVKVNWQEV